jgi:Tfp pilus assembly protein PilO
MKRNYLLFFKIAISLIVSGGVVVFGVLPLFSSVTDLGVTIHEENIKLEKEKLIRTDYSSLVRQYTEIQENSKSLEQAFVAKRTSSILETIEHIESLANARNVAHTLTLDPIPEATDTATLLSSVTLTVEGSSDSIFLFLKDLEDLPFYININSLDLSKETDGSYNANLSGQIYWL